MRHFWIVLSLCFLHVGASHRAVAARTRAAKALRAQPVTKNARLSPRTRKLSKTERAKFLRVKNVSQKLPAVRAEVKKTLRRDQADKQLALAAAVRLLDAGLRPGNEKSAQRKSTASFGALTLLKRHVQVSGNTVRLRFAGKRVRGNKKGSSKRMPWDVVIKDAGLASAISKLLKLPGRRLFQFETDNGGIRSLQDYHVRRFLAPFGAKMKDLRTAKANSLFEKNMARGPPAKNPKAMERKIRLAIEKGAKELHHSVDVHVQSYLDPSLVEKMRVSVQRNGTK